MDRTRDDPHVILRSTVYPGTTDWMRDHLATRGLGPKIPLRPKRISQGCAIEEIRKLPQIVASRALPIEAKAP